MSRSRFACALLLLALPRPVCADGPIDYVRDVKPIFGQHSYKCHGADKQRGMRRLDTASQSG